MEKQSALRHGYRFKNRWLLWAVRLIDGLLACLPGRMAAVPDNPRSILLMKPDHLGDMLLLTAVLPLLRRRYPAAAIDIVCSPVSAEILGGNPHVHSLIPLQHILYNRTHSPLVHKLAVFVGSLVRLILAMRRERYDLVLNLRDAAGDLILWARLGGCGCVVGHATGGCGRLLDRICPWEEGKHEVEHFLEVLQPLGISASLDTLTCEMYPDRADQEQVRQILATRISGPYVVLHPGCGDARKLKPAQFWADLVMNCSPEVSVVVTGTAAESGLFGDIAGLTSRPMVDVTGLLSIRQLFLLYRDAQRVYALDSLSAHLAGCAGVPVTVYWPAFHDVVHWRPLGTLVDIVMSSSPPPGGKPELKKGTS